jgi:hypothetical protein
MDEEMAALDANATWELIALPEDMKAIGCKWVYKVKHNVDGSVNRYKTRLVAKSYAQTYGIDYEETYSPVAKMTTIRAIVAMAAAKGWSLYQMDVKNVFLHGDLNEEVYMEQPPGYVDQTHPNLVCRLKKALYSLKQTLKACSDKVSQYFVTSGFKTSNANFALYVKKIGHGIIIIIIYVDDLIITGNSDTYIFDLKKLLKQKFEMKDLRELRYFLGIKVIQSPKGTWLLQKQYALNKLTEYWMTGCKLISIPLEQNVKLSADEGDLVEDTTMYKRILGNLIYMTITRPDLSYAIGVVSQFMQTPRKSHLDAVRRILRYIKHTLQCGIFYEAKSQLQVHGYTNANWVGNVLDRRSTSGFMFSFGSGVVSWSSKKQPIVALSSTEIEYKGAAIVAYEIVWLQKPLSHLGQSVDGLVVIYCDNISSILLANNLVYHARTKHIKVHYHFIREKILAKEIDLIHVSTEDQVANIFTKALGVDKLRKFKKMLGVLEVDLNLRGSV